MCSQVSQVFELSGRELTIVIEYSSLKHCDFIILMLIFGQFFILIYVLVLTIQTILRLFKSLEHLYHLNSGITGYLNTLHISIWDIMIADSVRQLYSWHNLGHEGHLQYS